MPQPIDSFHGNGSVRGGLLRWQVRRVVSYVDQHRDATCRVQKLADLVHLSASRFARAFRKTLCGFFHASYGPSTDLFEALAAPIVEQFDAGDRLDQTLRMAMAELVAQEVGAGAMSSALLKQVIIALLRRSLSSFNSWVERFSMLSDPQVSRAFSEMVAHPGAPHTVASLARHACLSRSSFMARFVSVVGAAPMAVLNAGYKSRFSFARAFRRTYGSDPTNCRTAKTKS